MPSGNADWGKDNAKLLNSSAMKKLDREIIKTAAIIIAVAAFIVAFSVLFKRNGGWLSLVIILSPMIAIIGALKINDHIMRKKYNLEKEKDSFHYKGEQEFLPYEEVLKRKHESDRRTIIIGFGITILLLGLMIIGAHI